MMRPSIRFLFAVLVLLAMPLCAQEVEHPHIGEAHGSEVVEHKRTMEMETGEFFLTQFGHLMPHPLGDAHGEKSFLTFYNVNLYQLIALGVILVLFLPVVFSFRAQRSPWLVRMFRGWVHWLRDEVVYKTMGEEEGRRFAPFFIYLFFFILMMNLLGLIPGSVTATATTMVTGAMAVVTFAVMVFGGMLRQGPVSYVKHLLPGGLPGWLVPLMAVVELIALFVKPFALMIRLFANMLAGHMLIYSFIGMIFVFAKLLELHPIAYVPAVATVAMAVFINIIEAFVVLLQAYIFMFLSVLFVQDSLHPAH